MIDDSEQVGLELFWRYILPLCGVLVGIVGAKPYGLLIFISITSNDLSQAKYETRLTKNFIDACSGVGSARVMISTA